VLKITLSDNKYLYNGKELQDEQLGSVNLDWYSFEARYYDPALGRFTAMDPIAEKFYHVTPYNYAENRPISGIDLWGLQYLDHNKARIIAQHGSVRIKKANLHNVTRNRINRLNENPNYWKPGEIGYNTTIGSFSTKSISSSGNRERASMDNTYGATDPGYNPTQTMTERGPKKDGSPDMRQKQRPIVSGSPKAKGAAGAALAINAINFGLEFAGGMLVAHDIKLIEEHSSADVLGQAIGDINEAIGAGMIPEDYMNTDGLTDILNVGSRKVCLNR